MRVRFEPAAGAPDAAGAQHLFDGGQQAVAILQHDAVELLALGLVDRARLQRLQIQPDGGHRRLQLVRDRVDEGVVLFVAPDLPHQKDRVQHDAADDHRQQQDPQEQQDAGAPVQQNPADIQNSRMTRSDRRRAR